MSCSSRCVISDFSILWGLFLDLILLLFTFYILTFIFAVYWATFLKLLSLFSISFVLLCRLKKRFPLLFRQYARAESERETLVQSSRNSNYSPVRLTSFPHSLIPSPYEEIRVAVTHTLYITRIRDPRQTQVHTKQTLFVPCSWTFLRFTFFCT